MKLNLDYVSREFLIWWVDVDLNTQFTFSLIEKPQWFYFPFGG